MLNLFVEKKRKFPERISDAIRSRTFSPPLLVELVIGSRAKSKTNSYLYKWTYVQ